MAAASETTKKNGQIVPGLMEKSFDLVPQQTFGESGDTFDHNFWRPIILSLWCFASLHGTFMAIANKLMLRGRSTKNDLKSSYASIRLKLPAADEWTKEQKQCLPPGENFTIVINFPTSSSRVSSRSLTPERMKCLLRMIMAPIMLKEMRFPATTEGMGYADMIRSFVNYERSISNGYKGAEGEKGLYDEDCKIWHKTVGNWEGKKKNAARSLSMVAGCFSSKEVYEEDETIYPGCIWWSGLHAMMTDAMNKIKAPNMPMDVQEKLKNSNFYGDFKKKLAARNINHANTDEYLEFMASVGPISAKFLRVGTLMTARESDIMNTLLTEGKTTSKIFRPSGGSEFSVETSYSKMETSIESQDPFKDVTIFARNETRKWSVAVEKADSSVAANVKASSS